jgi:hypothetical protein
MPESPIDVAEIFKQAKTSLIHQKLDPFTYKNKSKIKNSFSGYNFTQVSTKFIRESNSTERGKAT